MRHYKLCNGVAVYCDKSILVLCSVQCRMRLSCVVRSGIRDLSASSYSELVSSTHYTNPTTHNIAQSHSALHTASSRIQT
jgi:hypothetical protein